jgi:hypothetical protein
LTVEELRDLATSIVGRIGTQTSDYTIRYAAAPQHGAATRWIDVLEVFLPSAEFLRDSLWTIILAETVRKMRSRFAKPHEGKRERRIVVYDSDGQPLRQYTLWSADGEPSVEDSEEWAASEPRRSPPSDTQRVD